MIDNFIKLFQTKSYRDDHLEQNDSVNTDNVVSNSTAISAVNSYDWKSVIKDIDTGEELYLNVIRFVAELDKETVSLGLIRRKFRLGFNKAVSIMDRLADDGIVGLTEGVKGRRILISDKDIPDIIRKTQEKPKMVNNLPKQKIREVEPVNNEFQAKSTKKYIKPPTYLLRGYYGLGTETIIDEADIEKLITTMVSFGVHVKCTGTRSSPVCTIYSVIPESGTKVSKIKGIKPDLELSLGKQVEIDIGKTPGTLNIRVLNPDRGIVGIRNLIDDPLFSEGTMKIPVAAGIDDRGDPLFIDITKTPHLLIAGTTGSGKSVFINDIIVSVLYSCNPDDVQMILIDPKVVELGRYNSVPHLLEPVVTDSQKAVSVLDSAEKEMKSRYVLFAENGVRNIDDYNTMRSDNKLPRILIIVDEYAELMYEAPKELEQILCSLARMSRAAGMYLILATQRPNSEVITAQIRANIPARIAFSVINWRESHTILNESGAEKLLGNGDMLYSASDSLKMIHAQAAYVSDEEIDKVLEYISTSGEDYDYFRD